jgi:hypothetical protein
LVPTGQDAGSWPGKSFTGHGLRIKRPRSLSSRCPAAGAAPSAAELAAAFLFPGGMAGPSGTENVRSQNRSFSQSENCMLSAYSCSLYAISRIRLVWLCAYTLSSVILISCKSVNALTAAGPVCPGARAARRYDAYAHAYCTCTRTSEDRPQRTHHRRTFARTQHGCDVGARSPNIRTALQAGSTTRARAKRATSCRAID